MNNFLIECLDVSKEYYQGNKTIKVLENIKFNLQRGSSIGILGPSGSGKTTLLHILAGIDVPTSGEVLFKGQQFSNCDTNAKAYLRNQNIGFVYQFHHLLPEFNALENVALPILISGQDKKKAYSKATDLLAMVDLKERFLHRPSQLSGGERQRVAIARCLANSPSCLIMDEPTGDLDAENAESITNLIFDISKEQKTTLIIATHDTKLAENLESNLNLGFT